MATAPPHSLHSGKAGDTVCKSVPCSAPVHAEAGYHRLVAVIHAGQMASLNACDIGRYASHHRNARRVPARDDRAKGYCLLKHLQANQKLQLPAGNLHAGHHIRQHCAEQLQRSIVSAMNRAQKEAGCEVRRRLNPCMPSAQ
jgi:hypothetical protein